MLTCPQCKHTFPLKFRKRTREEKESARFAPAWKHTDEILSDYNDGYAILWLAKKYKSDKRIIRNVLKEKGIKEFRGRKGIKAWNKNLNQFTDERILRWSGSKSVNWKGGVSELRVRVRRCAKYRSWVRIILQRDNWTCVMCSKRGGDLEVDHYPKLFSEVMEGIETFKGAIESLELWDTNNGRTLCKSCHNKIRKSFNVKKVLK